METPCTLAADPRRESFVVGVMTGEITASEFEARLPEFLDLAMNEVRNHKVEESAVLIRHWLANPRPDPESCTDTAPGPCHFGVFVFSAIRPTGCSV